MTKREAAIVSAYTGILIGEFSDCHKYIEEIMDRPVWTHELGDKNVINKIKELSRNDFLNIKVEEHE
jgi:hypothetical protein